VKEQHLILGIGELLWDILPEAQRSGGIPIAGSLAGFLGGAPANFSVMTGRLGDHATLLSRIGRDALGRQAIDMLEPMPVDAGSVQVDSQYPTGRVTVEFSNGEPHYLIHENVAWDQLELSDEWVRSAERADAICFGTLAQRSTKSRQTIQTLVAATASTCIRVFDVNLRAPFYSEEVVQESLELSTVLKLNDNEFPPVMNMLGLPLTEEIGIDQLRLGAERLLSEFPALELIAITRGVCGSVLVTHGEWNQHLGIHVNAVDPIGCGDAFTAAMTHYMLQGASLATLNEAGNRWGAWVASQPGAMPPLPEGVRIAMDHDLKN
jgi:Sugar kinases, ribokinase family